MLARLPRLVMRNVLLPDVYYAVPRVLGLYVLLALLRLVLHS